MKRSTDRLLTTHCGSLPRPTPLLDLMTSDEAIDPSAYSEVLRESVADTVRLQVEHGIDVVTDGELSKPGFFTYVTERLSGFEARPEQRTNVWSAEIDAFPEYY